MGFFPPAFLPGEFLFVEEERRAARFSAALEVCGGCAPYFPAVYFAAARAAAGFSPAPASPAYAAWRPAGFGPYRQTALSHQSPLKLQSLEQGEQLHHM